MYVPDSFKIEGEAQIQAFFEEVLVKIPVEGIRNSVWRTVQRTLHSTARDSGITVA